MPRLVRRAPLSDRIKAFLDPADFFLWLSEELHESAWDEALKDWAAPIGLGANLVFVIARANSGSGTVGRRDDVFGDFDGRGGSGWFTWLVRIRVMFKSFGDILIESFSRLPSQRIYLRCYQS